MDFTREPVIESVITPKEGCKLVVRSSKGIGPEEYFVDAIEVVSFGNCFFYRSTEKPKSFLAPVGDYEVLEVRETRLVLKHVGEEQATKTISKRNVAQEKVTTEKEQIQEARLEKKRERRRHSRRKRREETKKEETPKESEPQNEEKTEIEPTKQPPISESFLPPPPTLISDSISRYKKNDEFKDAFYVPKEGEGAEQQEENLTDINDVEADAPPIVGTREESLAETNEDEVNEYTFMEPIASDETAEESLVEPEEKI